MTLQPQEGYGEGPCDFASITLEPVLWIEEILPNILPNPGGHITFLIVALVYSGAHPVHLLLSRHAQN